MSYETFAAHIGPAEALMTAMSDLEAIGLVVFQNVGHGNKLTGAGREVEQHGFGDIHEQCWSIKLTESQAGFLARLYRHAVVENQDWSDATLVDVNMVYDEVFGMAVGDEYLHQVKRHRFLEDLRGAGLLRRAGVDALRPTYVTAVLVTEPDPRAGARKGGLIDWPVPTPGFEEIEERIATLKMLLAGATSDDDLSDVGRRCRDIAADAVNVVFRDEMVPPDDVVPSRQDAHERLTMYLQVRAPGADFAELRRFAKAALVLANARTHSARTGRVSAIASAQGLLAMVRTIQALERDLGSR